MIYTYYYLGFSANPPRPVLSRLVSSHLVSSCLFLSWVSSRLELRTSRRSTADAFLPQTTRRGYYIHVQDAVRWHAKLMSRYLSTGSLLSTDPTRSPPPRSKKLVTSPPPLSLSLCTHSPDVNFLADAKRGVGKRLPFNLPVFEV